MAYALAKIVRASPGIDWFLQIFMHCQFLECCQFYMINMFFVTTLFRFSLSRVNARSRSE